MGTRTSLVKRLADLSSAAPMQVDDVQMGWPARVSLTTTSGRFPIALFAASVIDGGREREHERRIQNPGKGRPLVIPDGTTPLLLGLWEKDKIVRVDEPLLVAWSPQKRAGLLTRWSAFVRLETLRQASTTGWAEAANADGEKVVCFHVALLPLFFEIHRENLTIPAGAITAMLDVAEVSSGEDGVGRARKATTALVRDGRFGRKVVAAYDGLCAMCGLNLGLVEGAHIYPVAAPGSPDNEWNGLALCGNHHIAFDSHRIWVDPVDRSLRLHPLTIRDGERSAASREFLDATLDRLREPSQRGFSPHAKMFHRRYEHYGEAYQWAQ